MNKVLVSDYDKTFDLNDNDIEINKSKVEEFRKKGNLFVFATGRSYFDFMHKVKQYNLEYDYAILNHGATIIDRNDYIISNIAIDDDVIKDIKEDLKLESAISTFCCSKLESRVNFNHLDITKINASYETELEARKINELINKKYKDKVKSYLISKVSVEIISNKIDKATGINILNEKIKKDKNDIYTIGDSYSDIEMIEEFNGFCVKDAIDEVKRISKKEYNSVYELIDEI